LSLKTAIFYFSGTGNTECVAALLKDQFIKSGEVFLYKIDELLKSKTKIEMNQFDLIGFGHPASGLNAPKIVYDFIDYLENVNKIKTFIFKTSADFIFVNYAISKLVIHRLRKKGYDVQYERNFCMGSNWLMTYPEELVKKMYLIAVIKTEIMYKEITEGKKRFYKINFLWRILSRIASLGEKGVYAPIFGISLYPDEKCNNCRNCINTCPVENIILKNQVPHFRSKCISCMRCIYNCPQNAIKSKFLNFLILKNGYNLDILINKSFDNKKLTKKELKINKFFKPYIDDVNIY